jgi:hypothetical protein
MTTEQKMTSRQEERQHLGTVTLTKGIVIGVIGSLAGTIAMDLVMVGEFSMMGLPADTYLALIGSVMGGGVPLGVVLHLLLGSLLGLAFSAAVLKVGALHIDSVRKGVGLGILAGLVTIPLGCVPFAIITGVPIASMLSFSTIPHLVWGTVLGVVAGYGLRSRK